MESQIDNNVSAAESDLSEEKEDQSSDSNASDDEHTQEDRVSNWICIAEIIAR